jgi:uncharacterized protein YbjT (DUF2867 family)
VSDLRPILVTGATGFVGSRLVQSLSAKGTPTRCGSRSPARAARSLPQLDWVAFDLDDPATIGAALAGSRAAVYLVHLMADGPGYAARELEAARTFAALAAKHGLERIVYLGGVEPQGPPSQHLQSRLDTGRILRAGSVPTLELRAGMIIGDGSESWKICRDLAARLPFMLLPKWLSSRSCPVAIDDVITGLEAALLLPLFGSAIYDLPGPEVLTAEDILVRAARMRGMEPRTLALPLVSPTLSSYWLKLVSGADYIVAQQLVHGLTHDLLPSKPILWDVMPGVRPLGFEEAVRRATAGERRPSLQVRILEGLARRLSRRARPVGEGPSWKRGRSMHVDSLNRVKHWFTSRGWREADRPATPCPLELPRALP